MSDSIIDNDIELLRRDRDSWKYLADSANKRADELAARLSAVAQGARTLVWSEHSSPNDRHPYDHVEAETSFGAYVITWKSWKDYPNYCIDLHDEFISSGDRTLDEAKNTAQADFAKRVAACLGGALPEGQSVSPSVIEASESLAGDQMLTIKTPRGDEYVVNAEAAALALVQLMSDYDNERRRGWILQQPWFEEQFSKLRAAALPSTMLRRPLSGDGDAQ